MLRALLVAALGTLSGGAVAAEVRLGVLAFLGEDAAAHAWAPVVARLGAALPGTQVSLRRLDHRGLEAAVAAGEIDFVITNPGHYVELEAAFGVSRILTLDSGEGAEVARAIGSAVVVPAARTDLRTLADLRGARVAIVGREAFGGFQLVWRELAAAGVSPEALGALPALGLPMDRVLEAVARGEADAGVVRACLLERRPQWAGQLRVLAPRAEPGFPCATSTRLYPDWPLAALRQTPPELARRVAIALLSMPAVEGVAWSVPADYQSVHELFRELHIGPYAYLQEPTLIVLAERYWPWVAGFALALVGWVLYTVRVEHLVHVRTAALREALAGREQAEARIRAGQEQADHLARLSVLGELSGTLAHELNQPLATIGNYAHSLVRRADGGRLTEAAVREAAGEVAAQAERAAAILARIRAFARKRPGQREHVAPAAVAAEAVALFRGMLAQAPEVALIDELPPGTTVEADPLQLQQVLLNLLKNGYDAARALPAARHGMTLRLSAAAGTVRFALRDHGPGLDEAARARLFEPFFSTKPDGLGLGLAICTTIAEAHGGRLSAEAAGDGGPGMVFTLSLPADDRS